MVLRRHNLLFLLLISSTRDVVEAQLVVVLAGSDDATSHDKYRLIGGKTRNTPNVIAERVLLQELFGEVFEVTLREGDVRSHGDFGVTCELSFNVRLGRTKKK